MHIFSGHEKTMKKLPNIVKCALFQSNDTVSQFVIQYSFCFGLKAKHSCLDLFRKIFLFVISLTKAPSAGSKRPPHQAFYQQSRIKKQKN